jgi:hypothetical protein
MPTWLLLLYALPMKRTTARVTLWRKLKKFGAVQLKTSAYVLPDDPTQYERFQWLSKEIRDAGGEATLIRVAEIEGMTNQQIVQMFNDGRTKDYRELIQECRAIRGGSVGRRTVGSRRNSTLQRFNALLTIQRSRDSQVAARLGKCQKRFREIKEIDYFQSPAAGEAHMVLQRIEKLLGPGIPMAAQPKLDSKKFIGKTWLTRPRPGIDRAGSAWLIRKFIDPKAKFVFASADRVRTTLYAGPSSKYPNALPFDMADVEFSHHGDDCTFETLVKRFGIADKAVLKIAEMVHDADLEDGKFQRPECLGINAVLSGWARSNITDAGLLKKGIDCFEGLYQQLRK